jgi:hypothetical protein
VLAQLLNGLLPDLALDYRRMLARMVLFAVADPADTDRVGEQFVKCTTGEGLATHRRWRAHAVDENHRIGTMLGCVSLLNSPRPKSPTNNKQAGIEAARNKRKPSDKRTGCDHPR